MKSVYSILLLLGASASILAMPQETGSDPDQDPSANGPARLPGGPPDVNDGNSTISDDAAAGRKKCITFTSEKPGWHFATDGAVWPSQTGTFGSDSKKICVPYTTTGGAMFIGPDANPSAGSTKLECFFPRHGNKGNCDMSIVDGYSLSVTCTAGQVSFGGPKDLWQTGKACQDKSQIGQGICKNTEGPHASKLSQVDPFFREGVKDGSHYCAFTNCNTFTVPLGPEMKCHVKGTDRSS